MNLEVCCLTYQIFVGLMVILAAACLMVSFPAVQSPLLASQWHATRHIRRASQTALTQLDQGALNMVKQSPLALLRRGVDHWVQLSSTVVDKGG